VNKADGICKLFPQNYYCDPLTFVELQFHLQKVIPFLFSQLPSETQGWPS